jgi:hypothetical protein
MKNKKIIVNGYVRICKAKKPYDWVEPMDTYNGKCFRVINKHLYKFKDDKKICGCHLAEIQSNLVIGYIWYSDSLIPISRIEAFMETI